MQLPLGRIRRWSWRSTPSATARATTTIRPSSSICAYGAISIASIGSRETSLERGREEGEGCREEAEADCAEEEAVGDRGCGARDERLGWTRGGGCYECYDEDCLYVSYRCLDVWDWNSKLYEYLSVLIRTIHTLQRRTSCVGASTERRNKSSIFTSKELLR